MKIAFVGSRDFTNFNFIEDKVNEFISECGVEINNVIIVSGGANSVDTLAENFADKYNLEKEIYLPDKSIKNNSRFHIRNQKIVDASDVIIAFWDGESPGTLSTINKTRQYNERCTDKKKRKKLIIHYTNFI